MSVKSIGNVKTDNCVHILKAFEPISVKDGGVFIYTIPLIANANFPIEVKPLFKLTVFNLLHPEKASTPIDVIFLGILIVDKLVQFAKILLLISV